MFASKQQEVEVKSEKQLCDELTQAVKSFVTQYLDSGYAVQNGYLYESSIQKSIVRGVVELIGSEMLVREGAAMNIGQREVPTKWNPRRNVETRVDNRTPQQKASDLLRRKIASETAEFVE